MGKPSASRCSRGRAKTSICPDLAFVAAGCRSPSDHPATDRGETIVRWSFPHFHRADDDFSRSATESRSASTIGSCAFPVSACRFYLPFSTRTTGSPSTAVGDRPLLATDRGLGWGQTVAPTADPPLPDHSYHSLGSAFLALGHDFGTENLASPALFTTSPQPRSRLFRDLFSSSFQRLTPPDPF